MVITKMMMMLLLMMMLLMMMMTMMITIMRTLMMLMMMNASSPFRHDEESMPECRLEGFVDTILHEHLKERWKLFFISTLSGKKHPTQTSHCCN